jgi:type II secretory pathway pseudopilin PulG
MRTIRATQRGGFTYVELVAILAVVGAMAGLVLKAGGAIKERTRRAQCHGNLEAIVRALQLYTMDNEGLLPDCTSSNRNFTGTPWTTMWNTNLVADFVKRGVDRKTLYCPSNAGMNDTRHWDYWRYEHIRNRFVGYELLLPGIRELPQSLWRRDLEGDGQNPPDRTELTLDIIASTGGQPNRPLDATANARIDYRRFQAFFVDRTSHLAGLLGALRPAGGNIAFEDGHVEWRDFSKMTHRYTTAGGAAGPVTWDF